MKKISILILSFFCFGLISCNDSNKKEQEKTEVSTEKIEAIEKELDKTNEELNNKAKEAEDALNDLGI